MPEGGFLVKINGKNYERCYKISLDFDEWQVVINETDVRPLPRGFKKAEVIAEIEEGTFTREFLKKKKKGKK